MKTTILLLTVIIFSPVTFAQQSNIKTAAKNAILKAIADREAPGASPRTKKVAVNEPSESKGPRVPSYHSAQRNVPPLPFNPFPELQVYDLGDSKFVYDDRDVDYVSLRKNSEEAAAIQSANAEGAYVSETPEGGGGSPQAMLADGMCLYITMTGSNSYSLLVTNLSPGTQYLLTDKLEFINEIGAQWTPVVLFTAASNSATFSGTLTEDHQFFEVWDWDAYIGPVVTLANPSDGAVLSGQTKVTGGVGDIFSDRVAELYVDGDLIAAITNGPLALDLDTQLFTNGVHNIDVVVRTVLLTTNFLEFANVASATVTFSNFLTSVDNGPFFSGGSTTLKFATTGAADYVLEIYDGSDVVRRTITGTTAGGEFQMYWDCRDESGVPLPTEAPYRFELTATPTGNGFAAGGAPAPGNRVVINSFAEGTFNAGFAYLLYCKRGFFYGQFEQTDQELMERLHAVIWGADVFGPDPAGTRGVFDDEVFLWGTDDEKTNILDTIQRKDVGHVFYVGHSSGDHIGAGADTTITVLISDREIQERLTNSYDLARGEYNFKNPKRYVEMDGCNTSTGFLPFAFGIPKFSTDRRPGIARRSYFGWNNLITYGWYATRYQRHVDVRNEEWHNVDENVSIQVAMVRAIVYYNYEINLNEIGLYGSRLLTWAVNP
jgi:hypothetical protein